MTAWRTSAVATALLFALVSAPAYAKPIKKNHKQQIAKLECFTDEDRHGGRMNCNGAAASVRVAASERVQKRKGKPSSQRSPVEFAAASAGGLVAEARRYIGMSAAQVGLHRRDLWCSAFMRKIAGTPKGVDDWARSWLTQPRTSAHVGAIVIVRSRRMHVGVVSGFEGGNPVVISGNHNNRVREATYPQSRVVAYVSPRG